LLAVWLAHRASIDTTAAKGRTALMFTAQAGNIVAVQWHSGQGSGGRMATHQGKTALSVVQRQTWVDTAGMVRLPSTPAPDTQKRGFR
jgi:hypothetical protein